MGWGGWGDGGGGLGLLAGMTGMLMSGNKGSECQGLVSALGRDVGGDGDSVDGDGVM